MPYDASFYEAYGAYLIEKKVRANHDYMFENWKRIVKVPLYVVDLGCGIGEYSRYGKPANYIGVDRVASGQVENFVAADYTDPAALALALDKLDPKPNAFVSLFSIECCNPAEKKYQIYENVFAALPSVQYGLVSGFFYRDRRDQKVVSETGGIQSFQTIEKPPRPASETFSEFRFTIHTPSLMFGPEVVEVWKFLTRKPAPSPAPQP